MIHSPTDRELLSFAAVVRSTDGQALIQFLESEVQAVRVHLVDAKLEDVPRLQGGARKLQEVTKLLREAPAIVEKLRTPTA